jgi:RelB Antitoxin alpha helical domain
VKEIRKRYVVDEENRRVAVQIDLETFEEIEHLLEDRGLFELMTENRDRELLDLDSAKRYYAGLDKSE